MGGENGCRTILETGREKFSTERGALSCRSSGEVSVVIVALGDPGGLRVKRDGASGARVSRVQSDSSSAVYGRYERF